MAMYSKYHIYFHITVNIFKSKYIRKGCVQWYVSATYRINFCVHKTISIIIVYLLNIASKVCCKVLFFFNVLIYTVYTFK